MTVVAFSASRLANMPALPAALKARHVETRGQRLEPGGLGVDDRDLVVLVERLDDRAPDLPRPDEEDPHERVAYSGILRLQASATLRTCASASSCSWVLSSRRWPGPHKRPRACFARRSIC